MNAVSHQNTILSTIWEIDRQRIRGKIDNFDRETITKLSNIYQQALGKQFDSIAKIATEQVEQTYSFLEQTALQLTDRTEFCALFACWACKEAKYKLALRWQEKIEESSIKVIMRSIIEEDVARSSWFNKSTNQE